MKNILVYFLVLYSSIKCIAQVNSDSISPIVLGYSIEQLGNNSRFVYHFTIFNTVPLESYPFIAFSADNNLFDIDKSSFGRIVNDKRIVAHSEFDSFGEKQFSIKKYSVPIKEKISLDSINIYLFTMTQALKVDFPSRFFKPIKLLKQKVSNSNITLKTNKRWREMDVFIYENKSFKRKINIKRDTATKKVKLKIKPINSAKANLILVVTDEKGIRYFYCDSKLKSNTQSF